MLAQIVALSFHVHLFSPCYRGRLSDAAELVFHKLFTAELMSYGSTPAHIPSLIYGVIPLLQLATRVFPLPRRPKTNFGPVNPVNLMLKCSPQQSITAKTTNTSVPAG